MTQHLIDYYTKRLDWGIQRLDKVKLKNPSARNRKEIQEWESHILCCQDTILSLEKLLELENESLRQQLAALELETEGAYESASASKDVVDAYIDAGCYVDFVCAINKRGYDIVTLPLVRAKNKE